MEIITQLIMEVILKKVRNDIEKAIKDYYDKIHKEFTEDPDKIISSFPISEFYIKQDIEEYIGEEDWKQPINEEQYIKNWCEQSLEKILLLLGEPGHGKSSLCMKMVSDFCERKFCPKEIKKVFSFSLNPTVWIKELENSLDVKNIFILPHKQIMLNGKYNDVILDKEYLEESLIFLDGYDELYLKLQEYSKNTISFSRRFKNYC